jgi:tetratricopeptide (TPR) repeat protein
VRILTAKRQARGLVVAALWVALLAPMIAQAQTAAPVARAVSVQGTVEARLAGQASWQPVRLNDTYSPGDTLRVGERSRADLAMLDQSVLRLNANTEMTMQPVKDDRTGVVNLLRGAAHFFSRGPRSLEVQTPFTVAGVRGTEFFIGLEADRALLTVFEGTVLAQNPAGSLSITSGQSAVAEAGKAPVLRIVARPRDAVQWTLHYPPVLYFRPDEFPPGADWQGMVRRSMDAYVKGDLKGAFDAIATAPATIADPRFFAYRAHLLLAVGRADQAAADIERALRLAPSDPNALALQTIIAVAQGDRDTALATATRAVQATPKSAAAYTALSYAQQARFDLEGARKSVETAVGAEPNNALAWARLSELWASFGELDRALRAAERAATLEPNLSRTQTVLGYAYLMRVKTQDAMAAFQKAIQLDQADPLPRLGLGLATIREGRLHRGGREIEVAASLDPGNAIVRSYLGKTYYEEKRTGLDQREYAVAKELDPNDPTPWFYDAIAKQTTNRPVGALHDLQQAIDLNDNRAVYRSRLLLDADEASRSASLGRIYSDLGFQQLALVEGWKSVNTDPTNFSAHRLLADSYAILPRHEVARVSELLQSQLLQPLNMTPIQPRLAESNLFLISAGGPGALSFNEFNPVFNRNGVTLQVSGLAGNNETWGTEGVIAAIYQNFAISVGYSHYETDGFRTNAMQNDDIFNIFAQLELTPSTSVQAEYRHRSFERGDINTRFFEEDFFSGLKTKGDSDTYRFGVKHAFAPNSILLGSLMYQAFNQRLRDEAVPFPIPFAESISLKSPDIDSISGELQYLYRHRLFNLTSGVGYFDIDGETKSTLTLNVPFLPFRPQLTSKTDLTIHHFNAYTYANITPIKPLVVTLGASYDSVTGGSGIIPDDGETNQFNPKLGLTWNIVPDTTLRAAVFRTFKRTLITDQTLEPTQVAGFNQFFDDFNATDAWRYGIAVDQKITRDVFGGAEFSYRKLTIPFIDLADPENPVTREIDADENLGRAYLFWTPHPWLALRLEYLYERFQNKMAISSDVPLEVKTHRIPFGINFFHPSGLGSILTVSYVDQTGKFERIRTFEAESGHDSFWLVDAAINYRLPRRLGLITVGVNNVFDERFRYFNTDPKALTLQPDRTYFVRATVALP